MQYVYWREAFRSRSLAVASALLFAGSVLAQTTRTWSGAGVAAIWSDGGN